MFHRKSFIALAAPSLALIMTGGAMAQQSQDPFMAQVLNALLAQANSLDAQWQRGARPLNAGRAQFQTRLDADVRSRTISTPSANRLRADYDALVTLETQYAADGRFTTQERTELANRYQALTESYAQGGPAVGGGPTVAQGQAQFEAQVNAAVNARRLSRTEATALRSDYAALVDLEETYARGGVTAQERADLDRRLDTLDARLPVVSGPSAPVQLTARARLDRLRTDIAAAERNGILNRNQAADLRVQHGDLTRLEIAYARTRPSANDSAYLEQRIDDLERRVDGERDGRGRRGG